MCALWARGAGAFLLLVATSRLASGAEEAVSVAGVTASKWDLRDGATDNGCGDVGEGGCMPEYTIDGLLNDVPDSRWSCADLMESTSSPTAGCYISYDLGASYELSRLIIYFHQSDDEDRVPNNFEVYTSLDGTEYTFSFSDVNVIPTALGAGESFDFPTGSSGQYVRITAVFDADEWLSINEVEIMVNVGTLAPTLTPNTLAPTGAGSLSPTAAPTVGVLFTPSPAAFGGGACANLTVSGATDLNGNYTSSVDTDGDVVYVSVASTASARLFAGTASAICPDSADTSCTTTTWKLTPDDTSAYSSYLVYDSAVHPALITEIWFRLPAGCAGGSDACDNTAAAVVIACGDGTTATPAPVPATAETCDVVEVAGSQDSELDGFYYDEGETEGDAPKFNGYTTASNGTRTGNGRTVSAKNVDVSCHDGTSSSSLSPSPTCTLRQWWVGDAESISWSNLTVTAFDYYTYDEAQHPADIQPGTWYTSSSTQISPYSGEVTVSCALDTTPSPSPVATPEPTDGLSPTPADKPDAPVDGSTDDPEEESTGSASSNTAAIAGGVAGGLAGLLIVAAVAYKVKGGAGAPTAAPPSYDDLMGTA